MKLEDDVEDKLLDEQQEEEGSVQVQEQPKQKRTRKKSKSVVEDYDNEKQAKQKIFIRKYTGNGTLPLHESAVIAGQSTFLCLTESGRFQYVPYIEGVKRVFHPADTVDTQNPLPYSFKSIAELNYYLDLASKASFQTLYSDVESIFRKYVNAEDHYITVLSADIICSHFQDKFGTTHYNIFVGDNGSGKNSALLVFKYLGYRVFYGLDISAPNYFTFLGEVEECQGSTAEDEAEDIGYDKDKQKIVKGGYCSGTTVPKVDLSFGRKQDAWLTFCHKWFAMEELPEYKRIKGILDRSLVYNCVVGKVAYNIKDVIRCAGDLEHKALYDELIHVKKLLFCFRMLRYNDIIPEIKLNVIHRNAELTKPLLRLFSYRNDAPIALKKIRLALSKFILGKNESKKNSIESKLLEAVNNLYERRENWKKEHDGKEHESYKGLESIPPYSFYNPSIWAELRELMDGRDIPGKSDSFYSVEYGAMTHKRITMLYKSKLKAESFRIGSGSSTKRCLKFSKDVLDKLGLYYDVPNEIQIIREDNPATHVTDATHYDTIKGSNSDTLEGIATLTHAQVTSDMTPDNDIKQAEIPTKPVASVESVAEQIPQESWNGRVKEVQPRIFGDMRYLGRLTTQGVFKIFQEDVR